VSTFLAPIGGHMEEKMQTIVGLAMIITGGVVAYYTMGNALWDFFIVFFIIAGVCFAGGNKRF